ncbi:hypothetical protein [Solibacillus sp.]|uniref:hypothetical protein n=1 Tax=Solibacillus sp. TaxID=1909654 RepID=UPI0033163F54
MNIEIQIVESCVGFWKCLKPTEWIQLVSVLIAMFAAIASFITVSQQKKQFDAANFERVRKYRPNYKIRFFDINNEDRLILDLDNDGFHFFIPTRVYWDGEKELNCSFIKGEIESKKNNVLIEKRETLVVTVDIPIKFTDKGIFKLVGYDIEDKEIILETPEFIFEQGMVSNHLQISKQYLR